MCFEINYNFKKSNLISSDRGVATIHVLVFKSLKSSILTKNLSYHQNQTTPSKAGRKISMYLFFSLSNQVAPILPSFLSILFKASTSELFNPPPPPLFIPLRTHTHTNTTTQRIKLAKTRNMHIRIT